MRFDSLYVPFELQSLNCKGEKLIWYQYIKGELKRKMGLSTKEVNKHGVAQK